MKAEPELFVSEIFASIQGESHHAGYPCAFIRLTGCNLDCAWCDTVYAKEGGESMAVGEIVDRVRLMGLPVVEVTGGEPLFQAHTPLLLTELLKLNSRVLLETNGSLPLDTVPEGVSIIMDLKAPGSGMAGKNRWENLSRLGAGDEIKIVVSDRDDYLWAVGELKARGVFGRVKVNFSPVAGTLEPATLAGWMVEDRLDARFQLQLHRIIWPGSDRGV